MRLNLKWIVIAVAAIALVWLATQRLGTDSQSNQGLLLPELAGQLDDVARVEVLSAGERLDIALVKSAQGWGLEQRAGYRIVLDELRSLLRALAQVEPAEAMTSNSEYYHRLNVSDVADPNSDATAIRIYNDGGELLAGVLLGKSIYRGAEGYSYMRLEGETQSWLVRGTADVTKDPLRWLTKDIINTGRSEIKHVTIRHPDGEVLQLKRENEADSNLTVQNLAKDAELLYASVANGPAEALANLRLEDVMPASDFNWTKGAVVKTELTRRDDLVITVESERRQTEYFIQLAFDYAGDQPNLKAEAEELNARHKAWVYRVLPHKYQALSKRMVDMLKK